jgi:hypothetical protein
VERVARAYEIRWLVVNRADSVPAVAPLLAGERPAWVGAPILATAADTGAGTEAGTDASAALRLAVFPVCAQAGDARCTGATP